MIITEDKLEEIFSQIPAIVLNPDLAGRVPNFLFGDPKELTRFLLLNKDDSYPLIWLLPTNDYHIERGELCTKTCEIIIATRETDISLFSSERYVKSFKYVLNPISEFIIEGLEASTTTRIISQKYSIGRFTNFSTSNEEESVSIDLWDAIKITVDVEFNKHCVNNIKWQTTQVN